MLQLPAQEIIDLVGLYISQFGYPLIFAAAFLENVLFIDLFIPGTTLVWFAGFFAQQGLLNPFLVWLAAVAGAVLGNQTDYLIGHSGVYHLLRVFKLKERVEEQKRRHVHRGNLVEAFILYLSGYAQPFLLIALGALRIPWQSYLAYTTFSAAARKGLFITLGYLLGTNRPFVEWFLANFWWTGLALFLTWLLFKRVFLKYGKAALARLKKLRKNR